METQQSPRDRVLHTDDQLRDMIELLLRQANQRQFWLLFIDERGCLGDPLMPMADYPEDPGESVRVDDLGEVSHGHLLMHRIGSMREMTGNAQVVLVWEHPGLQEPREIDRAWARAMAEQAEALDVPLRAQFTLFERGVRQMHPDDYV
ncbi:hypothetical protein JF550_00290 [Microbacterium esteraromaticum]|uniref:Uncharacterized protein n=1 Tax=Microbacterium esteraromaticum TaxID=57043 RepID=A0A939DSY6_9MICO|nr:hypothetical protein [Microbacterium esteraromaticum]MBN8204389.1 hypothetical protein [Microbacterium esteraromaticum]MBN8414543.1 hypothetical protein [Microbacterium esteraromaticum]